MRKSVKELFVLIPMLVAALVMLQMSACGQKRIDIVDLTESASAQESTAGESAAVETASDAETEESKETEEESVSETESEEHSSEAASEDETAENPVGTDAGKDAGAEAQTTAATTEPVKETAAAGNPITAVKATVSGGTHYIGETLGAQDFTVTVTYQDGTVLTNPNGWAAGPLTLDGTQNTITVSYAGVSTEVVISATERPAVSAPENNAPQPTAPPANNNNTVNGIDVVNYAYQYVGKTPYVWGGESIETGTDCSGFCVTAYRHFGINLPHYSGDLTNPNRFTQVDADHLLPGDICGAAGAVELFCGWIYYDEEYKEPVQADDGIWVCCQDIEDYKLSQEVWDKYQDEHPEYQPGEMVVINDLIDFNYDGYNHSYIQFSVLGEYTTRDGKPLKRYNLVNAVRTERVGIMMGFGAEAGTPGMWTGNPDHGFRVCNNTAPSNFYTGSTDKVFTWWW